MISWDGYSGEHFVQEFSLRQKGTIVLPRTKVHQDVVQRRSSDLHVARHMGKVIAGDVLE